MNKECVERHDIVERLLKLALHTNISIRGCIQQNKKKRFSCCPLSHSNDYPSLNILQINVRENRSRNEEQTIYRNVLNGYTKHRSKTNKGKMRSRLTPLVLTQYKYITGNYLYALYMNIIYNNQLNLYLLYFVILLQIFNTHSYCTFKSELKYQLS